MISLAALLCLAATADPMVSSSETSSEAVCQPIGKSPFNVSVHEPELVFLLIKTPKPKKAKKSSPADLNVNVAVQVNSKYTKRNGGLKKKARITIDGWGRAGCQEVAKGKFAVFLRPGAADGHYVMAYQPINLSKKLLSKQYKKDLKRMKKEVLCKKCVVEAPVLRKGIEKKTLLLWRNMTSLQLSCKVKSSGGLKAGFRWWVDERPITKKSRGAKVTVKKGKESTLEVLADSDWLQVR